MSVTANTSIWKMEVLIPVLMPVGPCWCILELLKELSSSSISHCTALHLTVVFDWVCVCVVVHCDIIRPILCSQTCSSSGPLH